MSNGLVTTAHPQGLGLPRELVEALRVTAAD